MVRFGTGERYKIKSLRGLKVISTPKTLDYDILILPLDSNRSLAPRQASIRQIAFSESRNAAIGLGSRQASAGKTPFWWGSENAAIGAWLETKASIRQITPRRVAKRCDRSFGSPRQSLNQANHPLVGLRNAAIGAWLSETSLNQA